MAVCALVLDHVARHQVPAVAGGVEQDVVGATLDAAVEHGFQRLVVGILALEGKVVAKDQAAPRPGRAAGSEQVGQGARYPRGGSRSAPAPRSPRPFRSQRRRIGVGVDGFHQRGLAHATRCPTAWRCWRADPGRSGSCSRGGSHLLPLDPLTRRSIGNAGDFGPPGRSVGALGIPDEAVGDGEVDRGRRRRGRQTLEGFGDAQREAGQQGVVHGGAFGQSLTGEGRKLWSRPHHGNLAERPHPCMPSLITPAYGAGSSPACLARATQFAAARC